PVSSVLRALSRVTVGPAPGTASPTAPVSAYRSRGKGSTTRTAAAAGADRASAAARTASGVVLVGVAPTRAGGVGSAHDRRALDGLAVPLERLRRRRRAGRLGRDRPQRGAARPARLRAQLR